MQQRQHFSFSATIFFFFLAAMAVHGSIVMPFSAMLRQRSPYSFVFHSQECLLEALIFLEPKLNLALYNIYRQLATIAT